MRLHVGWKYMIGFLALNSVVSELHEQAHITTGRIIHGCYGPRDFNVWQTCASGIDAAPYAAPLAGPLFSYAVMWAGVWLLLRAGTTAWRSIGFTLIFAPLPFARIFTALIGGGDEKVFLTAIAGDVLAPTTIRLLALAMVLLFCAPPIIIAFLAIDNRWRAAYIAGFCILPMVAVMAYKFTLLNGLLDDGVLATPAIIGTPPLVLIVFAVMAALTVALWGRMKSLAVE